MSDNARGKSLLSGSKLMRVVALCLDAGLPPFSLSALVGDDAQASCNTQQQYVIHRYLHPNPYIRHNTYLDQDEDTTLMTLTDDYFGFYFQDHDPYYDCITEFDGEDDLPDWIEVLLDIEVDRLIKERM